MQCCYFENDVRATFPAKTCTTSRLRNHTEEPVNVHARAVRRRPRGACAPGTYAARYPRTVSVGHLSKTVILFFFFLLSPIRLTIKPSTTSGPLSAVNRLTSVRGPPSTVNGRRQYSVIFSPIFTVGNAMANR